MNKEEQKFTRLKNVIRLSKRLKKYRLRMVAAIAAGVIRSKVYFWIPSFILIFIGFAIYYPDNLARIKEDNIINLPWIAEHFGYGSIIYSAICIAVAKFLCELLPYTITRILLLWKDRKQGERTH